MYRSLALRNRESISRIRRLVVAGRVQATKRVGSVEHCMEAGLRTVKDVFELPEGTLLLRSWVMYGNQSETNATAGGRIAL